MRNTALVWVALGVLSGRVMIACAADPHDEGAQPIATDAGARRAAPTETVLDLALPERGAQVATAGREIPVGADQEWCEVVELPGDPDQTFFVGRTELAMTPFSHHIIVSVAPEGSTSLDDAELGAPEPCLGAHLYGNDLVTLAASSLRYSERVLPEGIGFVVRGRQRLVFDYHALNTSTDPVLAAHKLNLHFVERIDKPARTFGFYNQYIEIPAHTSRSFADECVLKDDLLVWSIARHTHRYGTRFRVWWVGGERDGELIWTSTDWESDINHLLDPPVTMAAGTGFRWECAFDNPTEQTLVFGPRATDEMCILLGSFAAVGEDAQVGPQSCYRFAP